MKNMYSQGKLRRMPAHFGATPGPRQGPDGQAFDWQHSPRREVLSLSFLTDPAKLKALLPPQLALVGAPIVTIDITFITELEWLAGRGYNMFGIRWPAVFKGQQSEVHGSFLSVLWENLTDPIPSGREELGFNKIYCDIPAPRIFKGTRIYDMSWMGFRFFELEAKSFTETSLADLSNATTTQKSDGMLHYKYVPHTGQAGDAHISSITFTPASGSQIVIDRVWRGQASHEFIKARWEDLPTMYHIVNRLRDLPVLEYKDAWLIESHGGKDLSDQQTLV